MPDISQKLFEIASIDPTSSIGIAVKQLAEQQAKDEKRRSQQRERWHRCNAKKSETNVRLTVRETNVRLTQEDKNVSSFNESLRETNVMEKPSLYIEEDNSNNLVVIRKKESKKECARSYVQIPLGFEEFWKIYPRKSAKHTASKTFAKLIKSGMEPKTIIDGARNYSFPDDLNFTPHASTWLNGRRWEDQPIQISAPTAKPLSFRQQAIIHNRQLMKDLTDGKLTPLRSLGSETPRLVSSDGKSSHAGNGARHERDHGELF